MLCLVPDVMYGTMSSPDKQDRHFWGPPPESAPVCQRLPGLASDVEAPQQETPWPAQPYNDVKGFLTMTWAVPTSKVIARLCGATGPLQGRAQDMGPEEQRRQRLGS